MGRKKSTERIWTTSGHGIAGDGSELEWNWKTKRVEGWDLQILLRRSRKLRQKAYKGSKIKTSEATKRLICRIASNNMTSSAKIVEELKLQVTPRTVRNVLNDSKYIKYRKLKKTPSPTLLNQKRRLAWAMSQVSFGNKWNKVLFFRRKKVQSWWPRWVGILLARFEKRRKNFY